jgi:hypothetical protein
VELGAVTVKMMRWSPDEWSRKVADCLSRLRGLRLYADSVCNGKLFKLHQNSLFEEGPGFIIEPVGGECQPSFEIVHPGGGAHLNFILNTHGPSGRHGA